MREKLASRLGFLMLAAGCAVGLGNVWRFPFVVGQNGGAAFVLVYLAFLALFGFPVLLAELAVGRGGGSGYRTDPDRLLSGSGCGNNLSEDPGSAGTDPGNAAGKIVDYLDRSATRL